MIPREAPKNPNTTSPKYNPNARCAYHSDSPGHNTDECWTLKNKIQDVIDASKGDRRVEDVLVSPHDPGTWHERSF